MLWSFLNSDVTPTLDHYGKHETIFSSAKRAHNKSIEALSLKRLIMSMSLNLLLKEATMFINACFVILISHDIYTYCIITVANTNHHYSYSLKVCKLDK